MVYLGIHPNLTFPRLFNPLLFVDSICQIVTNQSPLCSTIENTRQSLENELQTLRSSTTSSQAEIETLRERNSSLESSNRDALAVIDSKNTANADLSEELQKQHQKIVKLNQEIASLSQSSQSAQATLSSARFRQESLQQELELARRNNDWLENELKTKSAEALKSRKEKGARIAELQRLYDDANSNIESLTRSDQQLRRRLEEAQKKADDALAKVQHLQEYAARAEEGFKQELESSRRLVELKDEQTKTHKKRLQEVELRLEQVKDDAVEEVRSVRQTLEKEKEEHTQTSQQVQALQGEVDRLQVVMSSQAGQTGHVDSAPQTPRPNGSTFRAASPFGTPGSIRSKTSLRATDAIEELYNVKAHLLNEKRRNKQLQEELDDVTGLLEAKAPEINEANAEAERLRNEAVHMSRIMEQSYQERDNATKAARKAEAASSKAQAEVGILQTQLRDLSTQVHVLIFNIHAHEKGLEHLTEEEAQQYERVKRGEIAQDSLSDLSPANQFITERYVAFKDIYELQEKNQELLRLTRELADKMEQEEALMEKQQAVQNHEEAQRLRGTVSTLQDEVKSITVRMKSYMSERDMFRRMLQQKATPAEIHAALGDPQDRDQREVLASIEQNPATEEADLVSALRELQSQFDSYRNDQTTDRKALKEQIDRLSGDKSSLQAEVSKLGSQLTLASERYSILQSNFQALQGENQELQNRNQSLSEMSARQEVKTQQVAQDLVEARELQESLRNENANLKAEKTLWKSIQDRLHQDNDNLVQEKTRLNSLLTNQQSLQNERELGDAEAKRRLQNQVDALESEITATKKKLDSEREESRKAQMRKEYDTQQSQKRIDDLTSALSQLKQENVGLKTSRDHLQVRVDELAVEVRSAEERAQRLRPIPTPRAPPSAGGAEPPAAGDDDSEARIQELETEVSELKSNLELANVHLENARQQTEEYKRLSQEVEEELSNLTNSQEQYRTEMDEALASKDGSIKSLDNRVEALTSELATSTTELNKLRDAQAEVAQKFDERERMLNEEIARSKEQEEHYKNISKVHLQDMKDQAEIASRAQAAHDQELLKHAEARKLLQSLRTEHNELKTQSQGWKAEAESAKLSLAQSEQSWEERRQRLEQEVEEVRSRWEDATAQIRLLHQQLEATNQQIAQIKQSRASAGEPTGDVSGTDAASDGLRELNGYLRREKEILEVQYDVKVQEARRLQQQVEISQSQLDEMRLKLEQERRAQADAGRASMTHKELMDKLNELNIIRESNVTLRSEKDRIQAQLEEKSAKVEGLEAQIQPLEARVAELESTQVFKDAEIKQLQEDRERWQKRTESILKKYGQADPEELEALKGNIDSLTAKHDALKEEKESLQTKLQELETTLENERTGWKTTREKLTEQFKSRYAETKNQRNEAVTEKNELQNQLSSINEKFSALEKDLEAAGRDKSALEEKNKQLEQQAQSTANSQPPQAAQEPTAAAAAAAAARGEELSQQLENAKRELETITGQKTALDTELENLRLQLGSAVAERDQALARAEQAERQAASGVDATGAAAASSGATIAESAAPLSDEERRELEAKIATLEAKVAEAEEKAKALEESMDTTVKQRSDRMKDVLNKRLKESREALEKEAQESKDKLQQEFHLKLEQERAIWQAETKMAAASSSGAPPSTPAKEQPAQAASTPTVATPGGTNIDLSNLTDAQTRELLSTNPTVKSIVANNIKKKVDLETKKARDEVESSVKAEYEQKITTAKEQATALQDKKWALRYNMLERQNKTGLAKIGVVETAAEKTPQRPVVEVWNIAKDAKPPVPEKAPSASTPNSTPAQAAASSPGKTSPIGEGNNKCITSDQKKKEKTNEHIAPAPSVSEEAKPQASQNSTPQAAANTGALAATQIKPPTGAAGLPANPFANAATIKPPGQNPFAPQTQTPPQQQQLPQQQQQQQQQQHGQGHGQGQGPPQRGIQGGQQQQQQQQQQQAGRSGIPMPSRGGGNGGRGRGGQGGVYQPPARGGGRGFGGSGGGGGRGMNPQAGDFNPGNKRPRGDSEAHGGGPKRQRGGGGS